MTNYPYDTWLDPKHEKNFRKRQNKMKRFYKKFKKKNDNPSGRPVSL